jgi:hypothetical protein
MMTEAELEMELIQAEQQAMEQAEEDVYEVVVVGEVKDNFADLLVDLLSESHEIEVAEIDPIFARLVGSGTKDTISAGKQCFLNVSGNGEAHCRFLAVYLLNQVLNVVTHYQGRLHILYLVNAVALHCSRTGEF